MSHVSYLSNDEKEIQIENEDSMSNEEEDMDISASVVHEALLMNKNVYSQNLKEKLNRTLKVNSETSVVNSELLNMKKKLNAEAWSNEIEDVMQAWGEKAAGHKELHLNAASHWKSFGDKFYIPVILLTTLGGVSNFGAANVDTPFIWMYAIGSINMFAAALASLVQYYKPEEKTQAHTATAKNYGTFYRTVQVELSLSREDRMNYEDMIKYAKNEYDRIQIEAPNIPDIIIENFRRSHARDVIKMNLPEIVSNQYNIKISGRTKCQVNNTNATNISVTNV
jgi:flagellar assembly factor FliW